MNPAPAKSTEHTTLRSIEVFPVRLPLKATFTFASGSAGKAGDGAPHIFVRVRDDDGAEGWGEARPVPGWSYETPDSVVTTLRKHITPALQDMPVTDLHGMHQRLHRALGRGPAMGQPIARSAIDMALHDLLARRAGVTMRQWFGGAPDRRTIALSYTVTAHEAGEARDQVAAAREDGFAHFNFKAAVAPRTDVAVAQAVRAAAGDDAFVWADANQGYRLDQARRVADKLLDAGADVLEQPLPADQPALMRALRAACRIPLAIDEASVGASEFFHYAAEGLVDHLVLKITRSGGLRPSAQQIAVAHAAGLPMLVSGLTDALLTKVAACQLAAAHGFDGPAALNGTQFVDESELFPDKTSIEQNGTVTLNDRPGLGIEPDVDALTWYASKNE